MRKTTYIKKMKKHEERFDKLWGMIVEDTNLFLHKNPDTAIYHFQNNVEKFSDHLCKSGAWIQDRINGYIPSNRKSLTKKIRKALGYTFP